jgi:hypothetical protein
MIFEWSFSSQLSVMICAEYFSFELHSIAQATAARTLYHGPPGFTENATPPPPDLEKL